MTSMKQCIPDSTELKQYEITETMTMDPRPTEAQARQNSSTEKGKWPQGFIYS